jgi:6-phospho-beta-glucosidase
MKVAVIGCGLRTPLLAHGIARSDLGVTDLALYDVAPERATLMEALGRAVAKESGVRVAAAARLEEAVEGSRFVVSSIRVGDMAARARDERIAVDEGFAGQETTGPAGMAMALRTIPVAIEQARVVRQWAPEAWIVNFTNPAGMITQAIATHTGARVAGICDTPIELFHRIAWALGEPVEEVECDYVGLNHLGWVRGVTVRDHDVTATLLESDDMIDKLYPAKLFDPALIRTMGLIPTEYVFFYYYQEKALANQRAAGVTRGEELASMNQSVLSDLRADLSNGGAEKAIRRYSAYLNRRNASYLRLEGAGEPALSMGEVDWNPFEGATGYHRIAVEAMRALTGVEPRRMVLNVVNRGALADLEEDDVIETPCAVTRNGPLPLAAGRLPDAVRGLTTAVKTYERLAIRAAVERSEELAALALFVNPMVGRWDAAQRLARRLF